MKNAHLFIILLLFPLIGRSQKSENDDLKSGLRVGLNTELLFFGEYGINVEYNFGGKSIYSQINYNRPILPKSSKPNVDFTENTNSYYCASGPVIKIGFRKNSKYSEKNRRTYFYGAELIFKELSFDNLTLQRPSDKYYFDQEISMQSYRYGSAFRIGLRKSFTPKSKLYWSLSTAIGVLYNDETRILHYSHEYTDLPFETPYKNDGLLVTVSLNLVVGFDFSNK